MKHRYLIALFNEGYDFARKGKDGQYVGVPRSKATHFLRCTRWNVNIPFSLDTKARIRAEKTRPEGWALSVCATPLHRRIGPPPSQKLKSPIPKGKMPVFDRKGTLEGQRATLIGMVEDHHRTPDKMRRIIRTLSREKCYRLYRVLRRASQRAEHRLRRQQRRNPI